MILEFLKLVKLFKCYVGLQNWEDFNNATYFVVRCESVVVETSSTMFSTFLARGKLGIISHVWNAYKLMQSFTSDKVKTLILLEDLKMMHGKVWSFSSLLSSSPISRAGHATFRMEGIIQAWLRSSIQLIWSSMEQCRGQSNIVSWEPRLPVGGDVFEAYLCF